MKFPHSEHDGSCTSYALSPLLLFFVIPWIVVSVIAKAFLVSVPKQFSEPIDSLDRTALSLGEASPKHLPKAAQEAKDHV